MVCTAPTTRSHLTRLLHMAVGCTGSCPARFAELNGGEASDHGAAPEQELALETVSAYCDKLLIAEEDLVWLWVCGEGLTGAGGCGTDPSWGGVGDSLCPLGALLGPRHWSVHWQRALWS